MSVEITTWHIPLLAAHLGLSTFEVVNETLSVQFACRTMRHRRIVRAE
jgi:hypothetical protein